MFDLLGASDDASLSASELVSTIGNNITDLASSAASSVGEAIPTLAHGALRHLLQFEDDSGSNSSSGAGPENTHHSGNPPWLVAIVVLIPLAAVGLCVYCCCVKKSTPYKHDYKSGTNNPLTAFTQANINENREATNRAIKHGNAIW